MPTRRTVLGATTASLLAVLAGCLGDGNGESEPTTTDSPTATEAPATTATATPTVTTTPVGSNATVRTREHPDLGAILVDGEGMTLYMFDSDTRGEGESTCYDGCASAWPPLTVEETATAGMDVQAELTTFERETGEAQVAAGGWPLYYFSSDQEPGDANGQGANDVWWVLRPDGTPVKSGASPTEGGDEGEGGY